VDACKKPMPQYRASLQRAHTLLAAPGFVQKLHTRIQGYTLVHLSAQSKRFLRDKLCLGGIYGGNGGGI